MNSIINSSSAFSLNESNSSQFQIQQREELIKFFKNFKCSDDELMCQLGLFIRSSYLVKFLVLSDLYNRIVDVPGDIFEFGTRYGHNMVVFENLRAIYEPFNKTRRIIGFDTFEGYRNFSSQDNKGDVFSEDRYTTFEQYENYLAELLKVHERMNVLGHISGNHRLIKGDVCQTAPTYFREHPETIVALAYLDMGLYKPTQAALQAHLISCLVL